MTWDGDIWEETDEVKGVELWQTSSTPLLLYLKCILIIHDLFHNLAHMDLDNSSATRCHNAPLQ